MSVSSAAHRKFRDRMTIYFSEDVKSKTTILGGFIEVQIRCFRRLPYFQIFCNLDKYGHVTLFLNDLIISQKHLSHLFLTKPTFLHLRTMLFKVGLLAGQTDHDFGVRCKGNLGRSWASFAHQPDGRVRHGKEGGPESHWPHFPIQFWGSDEYVVSIDTEWGATRFSPNAVERLYGFFFSPCSLEENDKECEKSQKMESSLHLLRFKYRWQGQQQGCYEVCIHHGRSGWPRRTVCKHCAVSSCSVSLDWDQWLGAGLGKEIPWKVRLLNIDGRIMLIRMYFQLHTDHKDFDHKGAEPCLLHGCEWDGDQYSAGVCGFSKSVWPPQESQ